MKQGLTYLTNAIIRDPRVFHIDEPDTFIEKYDLNGELRRGALAVIS